MIVLSRAMNQNLEAGSRPQGADGILFAKLVNQELAAKNRFRNYSMPSFFSL